MANFEKIESNARTQAEVYAIGLPLSYGKNALTILAMLPFIIISFMYTDLDSFIWLFGIVAFLVTRYMLVKAEYKMIEPIRFTDKSIIIPECIVKGGSCLRFDEISQATMYIHWTRYGTRDWRLDIDDIYGRMIRIMYYTANIRALADVIQAHDVKYEKKTRAGDGLIIFIIVGLIVLFFGLFIWWQFVRS